MGWITGILLLIFMTPASLAQHIQPCRLVNAPTAGTLPARSYYLDTHLFDSGGVAHRIGIGVTELLDVGVSFSGVNIIGSRRIVWQPHVGAQVRIRVVEETLRTPAFLLGFDSQGEGPYHVNRFRNKSKGIYLVMSRNYRLLGNFGIHAGANYSLETADGDEDPSFWVGFDKNIGPIVDVAAEYDFATNDNENEIKTADRGYLNVAVKLNLGGSFTLEFDLQNILQNTLRDFAGRTSTEPEPSRELRFYYHNKF